jgi:hypothetical protein
MDDLSDLVPDNFWTQHKAVLYILVLAAWLMHVSYGRATANRPRAAKPNYKSYRCTRMVSL